MKNRVQSKIGGLFNRPGIDQPFRSTGEVVRLARGAGGASVGVGTPNRSVRPFRNSLTLLGVQSGFLLVLLGLVGGVGCTTTQPMNSEVLVPLVELDRGSCYGQCPSFSMTLYTNGLVKYNGRKFTQKEGLHERNLAQPEVKRLRKLLEDANLWQYQDTYDRGLSDVQTVRLKYYDDEGRTKTITMRGATNEESLQTLVTYLTEMGSTGTWTPITSSSMNAAPEPLPDYVIPNELIVKIDPATAPEALVARFQNASLELRQTVSAPMHIYLFTYRADVVDPREMLRRVRQSDGVESAEFNKRLGGRS